MMEPHPHLIAPRVRDLAPGSNCQGARKGKEWTNLVEQGEQKPGLVDANNATLAGQPR